MQKRKLFVLCACVVLNLSGCSLSPSKQNDMSEIKDDTTTTTKATTTTTTTTTKKTTTTTTAPRPIYELGEEIWIKGKIDVDDSDVNFFGIETADGYYWNVYCPNTEEKFQQMTELMKGKTITVYGNVTTSESDEIEMTYFLIGDDEKQYNICLFQDFSEYDEKVYNALIKAANSFKDPTSLRLVQCTYFLEDDSPTIIVKLAGTNSFGGSNTSDYILYYDDDGNNQMGDLYDLKDLGIPQSEITQLNDLYEKSNIHISAINDAMKKHWQDLGLD